MLKSMRKTAWVRRFRRYAESGDGNAQYNLGMCYTVGYGMEEDPKEAMKWFCKAAAQEIPVAGMSCRDVASVCGIFHKTAFYWRHKIMGSLKEVLDGKLSLKGIIEADETFFPISYKGNYKLSKDFVMPRKDRRRGKQVTKRGISNEQVCVSCMVDRNNGMQAEIAGLERIKLSQLDHLNIVESNAIFVTDKVLAYRKYAEKFTEGWKGIQCILFGIY